MAQMIVAALGVTGTAAVVAELAVGVGLSVLGQRLIASSNRQSIEVNTTVTTTGATTPQSLILGRARTRGHFVCPHYATGSGARYRVQVIQLSSVPVTDLVGLSVAGVYYDFSTFVADSSGQNRGMTPASGDAAGKFFIRFHDGHQTVADAYLVANFASHPERPWASTAVGVGNAYVVLTFADLQFWGSEPETWFVVDGVQLVDPRTGAAAWSRNPVIMAYNVFRGLTFADGFVYGLDLDADRLPAANWHAAIAAADSAGLTAGIEVHIATAENGGTYPLDLIDDLLAAADCQVADVAGSWIVAQGGPELPVATLTDGHIVSDQSETIWPVQNILSVANAVRVTFTDPDAGWEMTEAPVKYDQDQIAVDRRTRMGEVRLPAVQSVEQAQALGAAWLRDAARRRRQAVPVGPLHSWLRPLDVIAYQSPNNGYAAKLFQVSEIAIDPETLAARLSLREVDPSDWVLQSGDIIARPAVSINPAPIAVGGFPGLEVSSLVPVGAGLSGPVIRCAWTTTDAEFRFVELSVRRSGSSDVSRSELVAAGDGVTTIAGGLDYGTVYQVRARGLSSDTSWTAWKNVTTPAGGLSSTDLGAELEQRIGDVEQTATDAVAQAVSALSMAGEVGNHLSETSLLTPAVDGTGRVAGIRAVVYVDGFGSQSSLLEMIGDNVIALGTLSVNRLSVGIGGNLAFNADLMAGLLHWELVTSGAAGSETTVVVLSPGAAWGSTTGHVVEMIQSGASATGLATMRNVPVDADGQYVDGPHFAAEPGDRFEISVQASTRQCGGNLRVRWFDAGGIVIGSSVQVATIADNVPSHEYDADHWPRYGGFTVAPVGAVAGSIMVRKTGTSSGTSSAMNWHRVTVRKVHDAATGFGEWQPGGATLITGRQIVTGAITAEHLDVISLSAAGLATFGGALQSLDFVAGVSGWRIGADGTFEVADLIDRSSLTDGAVSDVWTMSAAGPFYYANGGSVVAGPIQITPDRAAEIRLLGVEADLKAVTGMYGTAFAGRVTIERRMQRGGVWGAWSTVATISATGAAGAGYVPADAAVFLSGVGTLMELRAVMAVDTGSGESNLSGADRDQQRAALPSLVQNIAVLVQRIMK